MSSYWEKRQAQIMYQEMQDAEKTAQELADIYAKASREINFQIEEIFDRFTDKHDLTEDEAKRLLGTLKDPADIQELIEKLKADPKNADLLAELESPAYRARIERLENLQTEVDRMMQDVYGQEKTVSSAHYASTFNNAYYRNVYELQRQIGFQYSFSTVDFKTLNQMLAMEFMGSNYSERIWGNTQALAGDIKEQLILGYLTGKTESDMAAELANKFATGSYEARRLVRTESNFQITQAQNMAYEDADIELYRNVAVLDMRTSAKCREMDGTVFPVKDMQSGENAPPFHPFCRTTTIAEFEDSNLAELKRRARDPNTGKNKLIPADTNYKKWYEQNVAHDPKAQAVEKGIKNWGSDQKQWQRYKDAIGKKAAGKTFADFQEMKYGNSEQWAETVEKYKKAKSASKPDLQTKKNNDIITQTDNLQRKQIDAGHGKVPDEQIEEFNANALKSIIEETGYTEEQAKEFQKSMQYYFGGDYEAFTTGQVPNETAIIDAGLSKMKPYDGEIYRGMGFLEDDIEQYEKFRQASVGSELPTRHCISSWTSDIKASNGFGGLPEAYRDTVLIKCVKNKTSVGVQHISKFRDIEAEVMAKSDAKWVVKKVTTRNSYDAYKDYLETLEKGKDRDFLAGYFEDAEYDFKSHLYTVIEVEEL